MKPTLSILTPTIPQRADLLAKLSAEIQRQILDAGAEGLVEHRINDEPPPRSIGAKRDRLMREARGRYVAFVDDDDGILPGYVSAIIAAAQGDPDVITFRQQARVNGAESVVEFRLGQENGPFVPRGITRRNAWHVCAWRRDLAILSQFPSSNYGEDWKWAAPLCALPDLREEHILRILHRYDHSTETTAAPPPLTPRP